MTYQNVEFDQDREVEQYKSRVVLGEAKEPGMIRFLKTHSGGLVKNDKQAAYLLLGVVIVSIIISVYLEIHSPNRARMKFGVPLVSNKEKSVVDPVHDRNPLIPVSHL